MVIFKVFFLKHTLKKKKSKHNDVRNKCSVPFSILHLESLNSFILEMPLESDGGWEAYVLNNWNSAFPPLLQPFYFLKGNWKAIIYQWSVTTQIWITQGTGNPKLKVHTIKFYLCQSQQTHHNRLFKALSSDYS